MNLVRIYGLFDGHECIYVGRTRNYEQRVRCHMRRFGAHILVRLLKLSKEANAAATERKMIEHYRALGQAKHNIYPAHGGLRGVLKSCRLDPVTRSALALYMREQQIGQIGRVFRLALSRFIPQQYFDDAIKQLRNGRRGTTRKAVTA